MTRKLFVAIAALVSSAAMAQTNTGSVQITGSINDAVAMSNAVLTTGAGGAEVNNGGTTAFDRTYNFGNINLLTPSDPDGFVRLLLSFDMRSNIDYRVTAQASDDLSPSALTPAQIGFAVKAITESTPNSQVFNAGARGDAAAAPFDATAVTNGTYVAATDTVTYASTLADAAAETNILTGERISVRGSLNSPNNFITVQSEFVFRPELFLAAGNFSHTVVFTAYPVP